MNAESPTKPADNRSRLKERRLAGSRQAILEAARDVLTQVGVSRLTVESVAASLGITKQALYYYFASKDALLFDVAVEELTAAAQTVRQACLGAKSGADALEALIRANVGHFEGRLDAYRLVMQQLQLMEARQLSPEQLARIRSLNDLMVGVAHEKLEADQRKKRVGKRVHPRRLAFAAFLAATGLLSMQALVDRFDDPLRFGNDELVGELCRVFRAAGEKGGKS